MSQQARQFYYILMLYKGQIQFWHNVRNYLEQKNFGYLLSTHSKITVLLIKTKRVQIVVIDYLKLPT